MRTLITGLAPLAVLLTAVLAARRVLDLASRWQRCRRPAAPPLRRDGDRLSWAERRTLLGIRAATRWRPVLDAEYYEEAEADDWWEWEA